jgi:hypothetical protein
MTKREFLAAGIGAAGLALSQGRQAMAQGSDKIPVRKAKTTKLFKSPQGFPNALSAKPEGLWIGEQKVTGDQAKRYGLPEPDSLDEAAWLVDWNGKLLKTVTTPSRNTSGMAVGGGYVWMIANAQPEGVFQVDMDSKLTSHRQIPFGMPGQDGGGSHGGLWHEGKLWIAALRLRANVLIDPKTWQVEHMIPFYRSDPDWVRYHGIAIHDGSLWQVIGNNSTSPKNFQPGLVRYSLETGRVQEIVEFLPGSGDPHALAVHDGKFITCDAGIHPGWETGASATAGWILQIDFV